MDTKDRMKINKKHGSREIKMERKEEMKGITWIIYRHFRNLSRRIVNQEINPHGN